MGSRGVGALLAGGRGCHIAQDDVIPVTNGCEQGLVRRQGITGVDDGVFRHLDGDRLQVDPHDLAAGPGQLRRVEQPRAWCTTAIEDVVALFDGVVVGRTQSPLVYKGDGLFNIAWVFDPARAQATIEGFEEEEFEEEVEAEDELNLFTDRP